MIAGDVAVHKRLETAVAIFLVDLSLRSAGHDYAPLWQAMQAAHAQRIMDTTWFVDVKQDVVAVTKALLSHVPAGDRIFVLELVPGASWSGTGLDEETKAWLARRVSVNALGAAARAAEAGAAPQPATRRERSAPRKAAVKPPGPPKGATSENTAGAPTKRSRKVSDTKG